MQYRSECGSGAGQFLEMLDSWLREPPADAITRWNWSRHQLPGVRTLYTHTVPGQREDRITQAMQAVHAVLGTQPDKREGLVN